MKDILTYKDFIGSVHFSAEDGVFFGKIDIAVNNAGVSHLVEAIELKESEWDKIHDLDLKGVQFL